jgi:histidyl-tRNA synthetase
MGAKVLVGSSMAGRRIGRAINWIEARAPADELLIIGANLDAANEVARKVASTRGAVFGCHRLSFTQFAATLAAIPMATRRLAPLSQLGVQAMVARAIGHIPRLPGAYVLAVDLSRPIVVTLGNNRPVSLSAGLYLYCGSAKGPGGLRARIARHLRRGKAMRWHIDRLTEAGRVLGAWPFVGRSECELVATLAHLPAPIEGFGSSDCRRCRSHLVLWPATGREKPRRARPRPR